mgnify:CR=1 FL=1
MKSDELIKVYKFCSNHKEKLLRDQKYGFYCLEVFSSNRRVDSIISESSKYSITKEFLKMIQEYWF